MKPSIRIRNDLKMPDPDPRINLKCWIRIETNAALQHWWEYTVGMEGTILKLKGLTDPDPLGRGLDPDPAPDNSIIKQK